MEGAELNAVQTKEAYPLTLENFGSATLEDLIGDRVVYRSLEPLSRKLSGLKAARYQLGLPGGVVPRKQQDAYAQVALWILEQAQEQRNASVEALLFIGDTLSGDGHTFRQMRALSGLPGACFIGNEKAGEEESFAADADSGIFEANRWSQLVDWIRWAQEQDVPLGKNCVVVLDLDKTAIGARGRNNRAIDAARLKGLYRTVGSVLGDEFDAKLFERHYDHLNRSHFHHLTEDNQDYLAYICLALNNDGLDCVDLLERIENGAIRTFQQFVRYVEVCIAGGGRVSEAMRQAHEAVSTAVSQGDPTPFKQFRREEFLATLEHMNNLDDDASPQERLSREICITQEVREACLWLQEQGCLVIGLSDKPDEASVPHRTRHRGKPPIHQAETHAIGTSIADQLARQLGRE